MDNMNLHIGNQEFMAEFSNEGRSLTMSKGNGNTMKTFPISGFEYDFDNATGDPVISPETTSSDVTQSSGESSGGTFNWGELFKEVLTGSDNAPTAPEKGTDYTEVLTGKQRQKQEAAKTQRMIIIAVIVLVVMAMVITGVIVMRRMR